MKLLFVVTSHDKKGDTGKPTGFYMSEVTHPWDVLTQAGYDIDFVSPKGGKAPIDDFDLCDRINRKFWRDFVYRSKIEETLHPSQVNPDKYDGMFYAGGHGAMWDFPDNEPLAEIARYIYEKGGIIGAVCHGPAGLINIQLSDGSWLVDGKRISGFTNEEEEAVGLEHVVPFLLEDKLKERGALFEKTSKFEPFVVVHHRIVTGQNPQSATKVGEALLEALQEQKKS